MYDRLYFHSIYLLHYPDFFRENCSPWSTSLPYLSRSGDNIYNSWISFLTFTGSTASAHRPVSTPKTFYNYFQLNNMEYQIQPLQHFQNTLDLQNTDSRHLLARTWFNYINLLYFTIERKMVVILFQTLFVTYSFQIFVSSKTFCLPLCNACS